MERQKKMVLQIKRKGSGSQKGTPYEIDTNGTDVTLCIGIILQIVHTKVDEALCKWAFRLESARIPLSTRHCRWLQSTIFDSS
jgi:hypothetical protein